MVKRAAARKQRREAPAVVSRPRPTIPVQEVIRWVSEARPDKDIGVGMTHYIVRDGEIRATNGNLTASYPWMNDDLFLVSGIEFERVLARMEEPIITADAEASTVMITSGRFSATIATLPPDVWGYHGVEDAEWRDVPANFVEIIRSLRAFIADKPAQAWMGCVAIEDGWCYATNGMAVAGSACDVGEVQTMLPAVAIDFVLRRVDGLESWHCDHNYVAFRWATGAWMRVQRVEGKFSEKAAKMVQDAFASEPGQEITEEFRAAFADVAALTEDTVCIFSDRLECRYKRSTAVAPIPEGHEVPPDREETYVDEAGRPKKRTIKGGASIWGAGVLAPVISQATHWSPGASPAAPAPFRGDNVAGLIVGRKE